MKPLAFVGSSLTDLSDFPAEARRAAGFELCSHKHAFQKKTQKTRKEDIALAHKRYQQVKESS